ncbi:uncharacterized protein BO95DRAFT_431145 [Aspergillus brunneoviolaceus CBS 621.78]|uniref:Uncharacterized protein n=1 Tax=Aspergillus brunneoviolaceus CBS 621.78 TaxID=1450534 RepID=A0ACD1GBB1_9EURO|nr:hypothetical protein BO95DRAFT_431145 [Aspergillus brunneoviolaceus CBS 621.78]RAH46539.1 hypothetical protein BO95DRAFT_431145 [Aspergillus brunneoviolaceus CBS 621.78]
MALIYGVGLLKAARHGMFRPAPNENPLRLNDQGGEKEKGRARVEAVQAGGACRVLGLVGFEIPFLCGVVEPDFGSLAGWMEVRNDSSFHPMPDLHYKVPNAEGISPMDYHILFPGSLSSHPALALCRLVDFTPLSVAIHAAQPIPQLWE